MTLEDRNIRWTGDPRFFQQHQTRSSAPRVWSVATDGNCVHTVWGQRGGTMQKATEFLGPINVGKSNLVLPDQAARQRALRLITLKTREGYREVDIHDNFLDPVSTGAINFAQPLPRELSFWKPVNSTEGKPLERLNAGKSWLARKRNGMATVVCKHSDGGVQIYSRRMFTQHDDEVGTQLTWNDRFHHIVEAADKIMPPNSILLGELIVEVDGKERFDLAQSYIKSLTMQSQSDQAIYGKPFFYCWDVAFWDGEDLVTTATLRRRYELIHDICLHPIRPVEVFTEGSFGGADGAIEHAKQNGWEGFVVSDPDGIFGDRGYNFKGKPDRPPCVTKLKPAWEDDFIALWDPEHGQGERSTKGSRSGGIKSVSLHQYDKEGKLVFIANVSSGLTKEHLAKWADAKHFPMVWQVEYTGRRYVKDGDDTNSLDFPRFIAVRTDKDAKECVNSRL